MKPSRILIFSLAYFPKRVAGAEVAVKEITDRISRTEAVFDMITLGDGSSPKMSDYGNVHVHRIFNSNGWPQKLAYPFAAYIKAQSLHKKVPYDQAWAIMASYAGFAAMLFKKKNPGVRFILTIQEGEHFQRRKGIWKPLFMKIFRSADQLTAISSFLAEWSRGMGATAPIAIVPNGVDLEHFSKEIDADRLLELKTKLCKKEDDVFLITTSRLVPKNAVDDIIDSLVHVGRNVKLLVLGTGQDEVALKCKCLKLGLNYTDEPPINSGNRIHFLGFIPHTEMPAYLAVSDIFVRPSLSEGLGNSFLEAMAAGIPVIATPVGGIPDFLQDGETGLFCEVKNPRSIAQKVDKYLKDAESRDHIVKKARAMVKARYQWDKIAGDMKAVLLSK